MTHSPDKLEAVARARRFDGIEKMTEKLDPTAVALRRSPFVRQGVLGPDKYGSYAGLVEQVWLVWEKGGIVIKGNKTGDFDLVPLQTKREPLRCFATINREGELVLSRTQHHSDWLPMIEAAELDRVKAAGDALADGWEDDHTVSVGMDNLVAAWREAVK